MTDVSERPTRGILELGSKINYNNYAGIVRVPSTKNDELKKAFLTLKEQLNSEFLEESLKEKANFWGGKRPWNDKSKYPKAIDEIKSFNTSDFDLDAYCNGEAEAIEALLGFDDKKFYDWMQHLENAYHYICSKLINEHGSQQNYLANFKSAIDDVRKVVSKNKEIKGSNLDALHSRLKSEIKNKNLSLIKNVLDLAEEIDCQQVIDEILEEPGSESLEERLIQLASEVSSDEEHETFIKLFKGFKHRDIGDLDRLSRLLELSLANDNSNTPKFALIDLLCKRDVEPDHGFLGTFNKTSVTDDLIGSGRLVELSKLAQEKGKGLKYKKAQETFKTLLRKTLVHTQVKQTQLDNELEKAIEVEDILLIDWLLTKGAQTKNKSIDLVFKNSNLVNSLLAYRGKGLLFKSFLRESDLKYLQTNDPVQQLGELLINSLKEKSYLLIEALFSENPINKGIRSVGLSTLKSSLNRLDDKEVYDSLKDKFKTLVKEKDYGNPLFKKIFLSQRPDMKNIRKFGMEVMEDVLRELAEERNYAAIDSYYKFTSANLKQTEIIIQTIAEDKGLVTDTDTEKNKDAVKLVGNLIRLLKKDTKPKTFKKVVTEDLNRAVESHNFLLITEFFKRPEISKWTESLITDKTRNLILGLDETLVTFLNNAIRQGNEYQDQSKPNKFKSDCKKFLLAGLKPKTNEEFKVLNKALKNNANSLNDNNIDLIDILISMAAVGNKALGKDKQKKLNIDPLITKLQEEIENKNWLLFNKLNKIENYQEIVSHVLSNKKYQIVADFINEVELTPDQCKEIIERISSDDQLINNDINNKAACNIVHNILQKYKNADIRQFTRDNLFVKALSSKNLKLIGVFFEEGISVKGRNEVNGELIKQIVEIGFDDLFDMAVSQNELTSLLQIIHNFQSQTSDLYQKKYYKKYAKLREGTLPSIEHDFYLDDDKLFQLAKTFKHFEKELKKHFYRLESSTQKKCKPHLSNILSHFLPKIPNSGEDKSKENKARLLRITPRAGKYALQACEKFAQPLKMAEATEHMDMNLGFEGVDMIRQIKTKSSEVDSLNCIMKAVADFRDSIGDIVPDNNLAKRNRMIFENEMESLAKGTEEVQLGIEKNYHQMRNAEFVEAFSRLKYMLHDELESKFLKEEEGTLVWKQPRQEKQKYQTAMSEIAIFHMSGLKLDAYCQGESDVTSIAIDGLLKDGDYHKFNHWIGHLETVYSEISSNVTDKHAFELKYGSEFKSAIAQVRKVVEKHRKFSLRIKSKEGSLISKIKEAIKSKQKWPFLKKLNQSKTYQGIITGVLSQAVKDRNYQILADFDNNVGLTLEQYNEILGCFPSDEELKSMDIDEDKQGACKSVYNNLKKKIQRLKVYEEFYKTEETYLKGLERLQEKLQTIRKIGKPALPDLMDNDYFESLEELVATTKSMVEVLKSLSNAASSRQLDKLEENFGTYSAFFKKNYLPIISDWTKYGKEMECLHTNFMKEADTAFENDQTIVTLASHFITIPQRAPRHDLLIKEICKSTKDLDGLTEQSEAAQLGLDDIKECISSELLYYNSTIPDSYEIFLANLSTADSKKEINMPGTEETVTNGKIASWIKTTLSKFREKLRKAYSENSELKRENSELKRQNSELKQQQQKERTKPSDQEKRLAEAEKEIQRLRQQVEEAQENKKGPVVKHPHQGRTNRNNTGRSLLGLFANKQDKCKTKENTVSADVVDLVNGL